MTIPYERTRALVLTKEFLQRLVEAQDTPHASAPLRDEARALLRHYPSLSHIELAHIALPQIFGPVPPFNRLSGSSTVRSVIDGTNDGT